MIENKHSQYLNGLQDFGLTEREAKVYLALLSAKTATISELQNLSGVRINKIYDVLGNLVRMGLFSERKVGRKRTFEILAPKETLEQFQRKFQHQIEKSEKLIKNLSEEFDNSDKLNQPIEYIEIFYGKEYIHRRYMQLIRSAKKEILGFGRPPYTFSTREKAEEQLRENCEFLARNGVARWVYEFNYPEQEWIIPGLIKGQVMGARFRVAEKLPMKMVIFDQREVLITQKAPPTLPDEMTNALIKNGAISSAFQALFEFFWSQSMELEEWIKLNR